MSARLRIVRTPRVTAHEDGARRALCIAPLDDDGYTLCGKPATTTRVVEDLKCPLCAEHAAELDAERESAEE